MKNIPREVRTLLGLKAADVAAGYSLREHGKRMEALELEKVKQTPPCACE